MHNAIMLALEYIINIPVTIFRTVFLVDSKSVLHTLDSFSTNTRPDLVFEIHYLLHCLSSKGTVIEFCWVPSHSGINGNEIADRAAKRGAKRSDKSIDLNISPSVDEYYRLLETTAWQRFNTSNDGKNVLTKRTFTLGFIQRKLSDSPIHYTRLVTSLVFRLRINALKTKFSKNAKCLCGEQITLDHILFQCKGITKFLPDSLISSRMY
eukprot:TRINITY_DN38665_c0_g1_i27.p1 TRINITY_DN38665_c0_g1~~TRINITY_DN38665_c0_g1_i27.p1  ORF type:complete len:230 (+),score=6.96 TRINITY_DN38665_c0_g1_i27:65-691(+)